MPDHPRHRGPHPEDAEIFAADQVPALREAVADLSWLFGRGYSQASALKLVGDRLGLRDRQRLAVLRAACSDTARARRLGLRRQVADLAGRRLGVDGFNVLIAVEAVLSGGVLFLGRDGALRDLSSVHGSYRQVEETELALLRLGGLLEAGRPAEVCWFLDRPVSNSGRLRATIERLAQARGWPWRVEVLDDPDGALARSGELVATTDAVILDRCVGWLCLQQAIAAEVASAWVVDLGR